MAKTYMKFYTSEVVGYSVETNLGVVLVDDENEMYLSGYQTSVGVFESKVLAQSVARRVKSAWDVAWVRIKPAMKVKGG